tara:strand:+ start:845 stop:1204 length:360 start_codon:yes stop_codon:yes gene_type:complete
MDTELRLRWQEMDNASSVAKSRADLKRKKLWVAAYMIRNTDVPKMTNDQVELLSGLAFFVILPAYHHTTIETYSIALQKMPLEYQRYFAQLVNLARRLDKHGDEGLAKDVDWIAWMESM